MAGTSRRDAGGDAGTESETGSMWFGPLIGLAALIALAVVYFLVAHPHTKAKATHFLLPVTTDQITALEFQSQGSSLTLYQNAVQGGSGATTWTIGSATGAAADQSMVETFVSDLVTLQPDRTLTTAPAAADLQSYGLSPATSVLTIDRSGGEPALELDLGVASPVGDYYAQVGGSQTVYMIGGTFAAEISADPTAWLPLPSSSGTAGSGTAAAPAASAS